jgi:hypothetical protein
VRRYDGENTYYVGFLGSMAILSAVVIFLWGATFQTSNQWTFLVAIIMLIAGLSLASLMVNLRFLGFAPQLFIETLLWTVVSCILIWIVNTTVPISFEVTPFSEQTFAVLMGVGEECFFRLFLCTFIKKFTGSQLLAIMASSVIWSLYHVARYGGNTGALFIVFMAGLVLGAVFFISKMGDGVIFAHGTINYIATSKIALKAIVRLLSVL